MTRLLEEGIKAVRELPEECQDVAGELLLALAEQNNATYRLTPEQIEEVKRIQTAIREGKTTLVSDEEMTSFWKKLGSMRLR
jgi:hypothetical protein